MLSNSSSIPMAAVTSSLTSSIALQACRRPWRPGTRKRWNCSRGRRTAPPWRRGRTIRRSRRRTTTTRGAGRTRKRRMRCDGRRPPPWRCARPASPARGGSGFLELARVRREGRERGRLIGGNSSWHTRRRSSSSRRRGPGRSRHSEGVRVSPPPAPPERFIARPETHTSFRPLVLDAPPTVHLPFRMQRRTFPTPPSSPPTGHGGILPSEGRHRRGPGPRLPFQPDNSHPGDPVVEKAVGLLSREHCTARLERVWGPGDGRPVKELKDSMDQLLKVGVCFFPPPSSFILPHRPFLSRLSIFAPLSTREPLTICVLPPPPPSPTDSATTTTKQTNERRKRKK